MSIPLNFCLIFGYHGVIGASAFDAVCEYTRRVVSSASDRALATGSLPLTDAQIFSLREVFFDINSFSKRAGSSALHRLETGTISRREFVREARKEFLAFLDYVVSGSGGSSVDKYRPFTDGGFLNAFKDLYDPECILCVMEKAPLRKNVLNLIHFLRTKFQDVKVGVVCNNWEAEGAYVANTMAARRTGMPVFIPGTCPQEHREPNETFKMKRFTTNGLFDSVVQSYAEKTRKPSASLISQAVETLTEMSSIPEDVSRSRVYVFEGRQQNAKVSREVAGVSKSYHIVNGPADVYQGVCDALKDISALDSRWSKAYAQFIRVIGPLFEGCSSEGWRFAEMTNSDGNMLFLPPPIDSRLEKVEGVIVGPMHRAVLTDLRDCLPQCFPLTDGDISSACGGGIGGVAGPVLFERYKGRVLADAYRITLQTGSYVVRIEPKGGPKAAAILTLTHGSSVPKLIQAGMAYAQGGVPLAKSYRITKELSASTGMPLAESLAFIASEVNSIGRDLTVQRYLDCRSLHSIRELVDGAVVRGYSESRSKSKYSLSPSLFIDALLAVTATLHSAKIPEDLKDRAEQVQAIPDHPLLFAVKECRGYLTACKVPAPKPLESLGNALVSYLEKERVSCTHPGLTFGFMCVENFLLAHRSLEGHPDYPIDIVAVTNMGGCDVGDPLLDLAALTLVTKSPLPDGIVGLPIGAKALFPTEGEIIDRYVAAATAKGVTFGLSTDEIKSHMFVYQAVHCFRRGSILFAGIKAAKLQGVEADRRMQLADRSCRLGLNILAIGIKGQKSSSKL